MNSNDSGYVTHIKPGLKFIFSGLKEDESFETNTGDERILNYLIKTQATPEYFKIFINILLTILITN